MQSARLIIHRGTGFADRIRAYKLFANGDYLGKIRRNSQLAVELEPGVVSLEGRIDWTSSAPLLLHLVSGEVTHVEVSNTYGALKAGWAITGGADTYLTLRQLDGPPA